MRPSPALTTLVLALASVACKDAPPPSQQAKPDALEARGEPTPTLSGEGQRLSAAGVELRVPDSWEIVAENEPDFALARAPASGSKSASAPLCTIELHRHGPGTLAVNAKRAASNRRDETDYTLGKLRGRMRELPGPASSPGSRVLVHCRSSHGAQWSEIEAAFASIRTVGEAETSPDTGPDTGPDTSIVELCTGTPARRTQVCARRRDGAVFCGASTSDTLTRVAGVDSIQLACQGARVCSRDPDGRVSCWSPTSPPEAMSEFGRARDIERGCVVDEQGGVACRRRDIDGSTTELFAELSPLGGPPLRDVDQILPESDAEHGCVLSDGALRCWGPSNEPDAPQLASVELDAPGEDLDLLGGNVCVRAGARWTCIAHDLSADPPEQRWTFDGCASRPCGCSLIGSSRLACVHEPHERLDARPLGRISGVVAVDGACAALRDSGVVCRGPVEGKQDDEPHVAELVAGGVPGVLHLLKLKD